MATFPSFTECNLPAESVFPNVQGVEPQKDENTINASSRSATKQILYRGWRGRIPDPTAPLNSKGDPTAFLPRAIGGFRFYNNAGDALSRKDYSGVQNSRECISQLGGGIGKMHQPRCGRGRSERNTSGVETFSGNPKYVYDSSNYMTYRKQKALNRGYVNIPGTRGRDTRVYANGGSSRCSAATARSRLRV